MKATGLPRVLDAAASIAMIIASAVIVWSARRLDGDGFVSSPPVEVVQDVSEKYMRVSLRGLDGTRPDGAALAIVEYSDFECAFCAKHATETLPRLLEEFVKGGTVAYLVSYLPLERIHRNAMRAAVGARCASQQGQFWPMHKELFDNPALLNSLGEEIAELPFQLNMEKFRACTGTAEADIRVGLDSIRALGITSTPTFLLGSVSGGADGTMAVTHRINGAAPLDSFRSALQAIKSR